MEETKPKLKRVVGRQIIVPKQEPSVALMLQAVIEKGVTAENVAALESLVGLYDRMQAKDAERQFNEAFIELRKALPVIAATKPVMNKDGTVRFRYAPLDEMEPVVRPIALEHGFTYSFNEGDSQNGKITKVFTMFHKGGHKRSNSFTVRVSGPPGTSDSQADNSTHSYAKRGAFCDGLGIIVDHDDDARMIGKPIGKALAQDLMARVTTTESDEKAFLKFAGVNVPDVPEEPKLQYYEQIPEDRYDALDEILRRKEGKLI